MLCLFQVYRRVIQLYVYLFFFKLLSHLVYYRVLRRFHGAIRQVLIGYLFFPSCLFFTFGFTGSLLLLGGFLQLLCTGDTLHCGSQVPLCGGLSCCGSQVLGTPGSVVPAWCVGCRKSGLQQQWPRGSLVLGQGQASVVVAHELFKARGMWNLPAPGTEPESPALLGRFPLTVPPGKSSYLY